MNASTDLSYKLDQLTSGVLVASDGVLTYRRWLHGSSIFNAIADRNEHLGRHCLLPSSDCPIQEERARQRKAETALDATCVKMSDLENGVLGAVVAPRVSAAILFKKLCAVSLLPWRVQLNADTGFSE